MRKLLTVSVLFLMVASLTTAHPFSMSMLQENNTQHLEQEVNYYTGDVPAFLGALVGDQVINARIEGENRTVDVGARMNGTRVEDIRMEMYDDPTMNVKVTESQISNITSSGQPVETLNRKLEQGEIEYDSEGVVNSVRTIIAEQLLSLTSAI